MTKCLADLECLQLWQCSRRIESCSPRHCMRRQGQQTSASHECGGRECGLPSQYKVLKTQNQNHFPFVNKWLHRHKRHILICWQFTHLKLMFKYNNLNFVKNQKVISNNKNFYSTKKQYPWLWPSLVVTYLPYLFRLLHHLYCIHI